MYPRSEMQQSWVKEQYWFCNVLPSAGLLGLPGSICYATWKSFTLSQGWTKLVQKEVNNDSISGPQ